jgi:dihydrofolate reductase
MGRVIVIQFVTLEGAMAKIVVSHQGPALDIWSNSSLLSGDLIETTRAVATDRDVVVVGSTSVVHQLAAADAVDEYRLLTIPIAVGTGTPLFISPVSLQLTSVEATDTMVLTRYQRIRS